jgi:hypothetical protein
VWQIKYLGCHGNMSYRDWPDRGPGDNLLYWDWTDRGPIYTLCTQLHLYVKHENVNIYAHTDKWLTTAESDWQVMWQTQPLRGGTPQRQFSSCQTVTNIWSSDQSRHNDWLSVAAWLWRMESSGMLHHVALVRTDVSEERCASIIRVTRIELGTLAVTSNWRTLQRNTNTL